MATKAYPMDFLSHVEMSRRGQNVTMVSKSVDEPELMAVMWADRYRRYFKSSAGTTRPVNPIYRERWRTSNGFTQKEEITIDIPDVCKRFCDTSS